MPLTGSGPVKHVQELNDISVAGGALEGVSCAIEAEHKPIWRSLLIINIIVYWVLIGISSRRHGVRESRQDGTGLWEGESQSCRSYGRTMGPLDKAALGTISNMDSGAQAHEAEESVK